MRNLHAVAVAGRHVPSPKSRLRSFIEDTWPQYRTQATTYLRSLGFGASLRIRIAPIHDSRSHNLRSLGFGASLRNLEPEADPSQPCVSPKSRLRSFIEETPKPESTPTATDYLRSLGFGASLRRGTTSMPSCRHSRSPKSRLRSFIEDFPSRRLGSWRGYLRSLGFGASLRNGRHGTRMGYCGDLRSLGFGASLRNGHTATTERPERGISEVSASELH